MCLVFPSLLGSCICTKGSVLVTLLVAKIKTLPKQLKEERVYCGSWFESTVYCCGEGRGPGVYDS